MRPTHAIRATLVAAAGLAAATAASAADMPRSYRSEAHARLAYTPRGPAPVQFYAPRYRVIYQIPSEDCARDDFCSAAF